jgi:HSP20 family protein
MALSPFHGIFSNFGNVQSPRSPAHPAGEDSDLFSRSSGGRSGTTTSGQIAVDIYEKDNYYIIRAPIAGVPLTDIDIEVDGKVVTIRGVRRAHDEVASDQYYVQECYWGEFSRSVTLPCTVDPKRVKATFSKDGVLKVLIPKEERVKVVRISEG